MDAAGFDADVVIVGYGPVGVSAANFLGHGGVRTLVIERDKDIYPRARAVTVNDWTLRAYQSVGLSEPLKADMDENGALIWKIYSGRKTVFRLMPAAQGLGHPGSMMIYQPKMELTLRAGADRYDSVEVRFGESVTGVTQDTDGVTVAIGDRTVRARYLLACDGGSSTIRGCLGIGMTGMTHETRWIVIDSEVLRWWPGCNDLIFWSDPSRPVVDIPLALGNHRWELPLRENEKQSDFDSEEAVWGLLEPLGITKEHVRYKQHAFYSHHVRSAERWREGRVILAGDAAHLMPPWAGQGMQSGVRDVHNVCWKLREALAGRLGQEVLNSYQTERAPDVAQVTELSRRLGLLIAGRDPKFVALRNHLGPLVMRSPALTRKLMPGVPPMLTGGWLNGTPGKASAVGRMIPQPPMWDCTGRAALLDDALGSGFAVLALNADPRDLLPAADAAAWRDLGARFVTIRSKATPPLADTDLIDHTGALGAWLRQYRTPLVVVRPDRFIAASAGDPAGTAPPTPVRPARELTHDTADKETAR
jgi:3-(3-hydroxy-phenyl)propionate hydroxylase